MVFGNSWVPGNGRSPERHGPPAPLSAPLPAIGGGEDPPPVPPGLSQLAAQLHELRQAVRDLQEAVQAMRRHTRLRMPKLEVDRLEIGQLAFNLDHITIHDLGGEFNLGLTHKLQVGGGTQVTVQGGEQAGRRKARASGGGSGRPGPPIRRIWPPAPEEGTER